ncbi:MAG: fatty acid--CoA ligase family protein [Lachnospiraceae bacterium]|nr:fatty acid--CoA ligase family protein [Lachnospiraceae bacterium]
MKIDYILDRLRENKDKLAVVSDNKEYTFGDIYEEYQKVTKLLEENNISSGNVVSIIAEFTPVSIAFLVALIERDVIIVPISKTIKGKENYIRISESQYVINLQEDIEIRKTDYEVKHEMLRGLIEKKAPGLILFSSGTTGEPKAALHDLTYLIEKFNQPGKCLRTVTFLLFDHIGGFNTIMHSLSSGCMIATLKTRSPEEVCGIIEKYDIELLPTSPTFINMILLSRVYEKYDLSSLKMISYGTEPMPESTLKQLHKILPDVRLKQTYGLSEIGIMSTKSESSDSLWMKIGGMGYETKIEDDILYIKARSAMIGYLNAPSPFDEEGWFNTKDKVEVKGDYLKILGRTTDLINVGGEKVYPNEIESVLLSFDGVKDVYVYGEANPITGQSVIANICVEDKNNNRDYIKQLRKYCKENLESYKRPVSYRLTTETFYGDRFKKKR